MKDWSAHPLRFLLFSICEAPRLLTASQKIAAGEVARSLFSFALSREQKDKILLRTSIEAVCRTYDAEPAVSKTLLSMLLTKDSLTADGYENIPVLAREANGLLQAAPDFVCELYRAAFGHDETSTDSTAMGAGRILPLISNRRQDYGHGLWQLGETFPNFLRLAPEYALTALNSVISRHRSVSASEIRAESFEFNGVTASLTSDGSYIWDATQYRHEPHLKMLDALREELHRLSNDSGGTAQQSAILELIAKKCTFASIWRQTLQCGVRNPTTLGGKLLDLVCALPILTAAETSNIAGNLIAAIYPSLNKTERERLEAIIVSIPTLAGSAREEIALRIRDRLLGCIPADLAESEAAKTIIADFKTKGGPPANRPPFQIESSFHEYSEARYLSDHGVVVEDAANRKISEAAKPVQEFVKSCSNRSPTAEELNSALEQAKVLQTVLVKASSEGAHDLQIDVGLNHLLAFCVCAARCPSLDCNAPSGHLIVEILLAAAEHSSPQYQKKWAEDFDEHASWGPAPRIYAAEGLSILGSRPDVNSPLIIKAIERLCKDKVPAVRLQITDYLGQLRNIAPEAAKTMLTQMVTADPSSSVVDTLLVQQVHPLIYPDRDEARSLVMAAFNRTDLQGDAAAKVKSTCIAILLDLYLLDETNAADNYIDRFTNDVVQFTEEALHIVSRLRDVLVAGPVAPIDEVAERARKRSFAILNTLVKSAQSGIAVIQTRNSSAPFADWPAADRSKIEKIVYIFDSISSQLFFASGAFDSKDNSKTGSIDPAQKERFLEESLPLLDLLCTQAHPSTIHHLIEMLKSLLHISPRVVFLKIGQVVTAGQRSGYQFESLAVGEIVEVVNIVLADFRPLLQADPAVREAMISILDVFVKAGWPQALQLTYRLDEVFR